MGDQNHLDRVAGHNERHWGCFMGEGKGVGNTRAEHMRDLARTLAADVQCIEIEQHLPKVEQSRIDARAMMGETGPQDEDFIQALDGQFATVPDGKLVMIPGYPNTPGLVEHCVRRHGLPRFVIYLQNGDTPKEECADLKPLADVLGGFGKIMEVMCTPTTKPDRVQKVLLQKMNSPPLLPRARVETGADLPIGKNTPITILQWNVLADGLCGNSPNSGGFSRCPKKWLDSECRFPQLYKAIAGASADVVALQETDNWPWWQEHMAKLGYDSQSRIDETSACLTVAVQEPKWPDSISLFWKRNRFKLDEMIVGEDPADVAALGKNRYMMARLRISKTGEYVVVCNAHLHSTKSAEGAQVRVDQTRRMMDQLDAMAMPTDPMQRGKAAQAVFLCGDLNARRGEQCHTDIMERTIFKVTPGMQDVMANHGYKDDVTSVKVRTGSYKAGKVAYAVDHMLTTGAAVPTLISKLPTMAEIGPTGLPSVNWPSDHLYLYVEFMICAKIGGKNGVRGQREVANPMNGSAVVNPMAEIRLQEFDPRGSMMAEGLMDASITDAENVTLPPASGQQKQMLIFCCGALFVIGVALIFVVSANW